jgi:spectinomycin phosphotransferase
VNTLPDDFDVAALPGFLADGWGFDVETADYAPLGAGSYHWLVRDAAGTHGFVTVDDLDHKSWLGSDRELVFDGLRCAFDTAGALRDSGLSFVVAPTPACDGETVLRVAPRYALALFPFVDGEGSTFGRHEGAGERAAIVALLAELHQASADVAAVANRVGLELPGRHHLDRALSEVDEPWQGGPLSEPARAALAAHAAAVAELVAVADRLAASITARGSAWVVTHGEPHAGNVMRAGERRLLVDWDTVALAPPERDLWMVVESAEEAASYAAATGREVDDDAMSFFRITWDLKDLAECLDTLRSPHRDNEDMQRIYGTLVSCVTDAAARGTPRATRRRANRSRSASARRRR